MKLFKILLIDTKAEEDQRVVSELRSRSFICDHIVLGENAEEEIVKRAPDVVILALENPSTASALVRRIKGLRRERPLPILALIPNELSKYRETLLSVDDFAVESYHVEEIAVRVEKIVKDTYTIEGPDLIRSGDLMIDLSRREVTIEGKPLSLTFKEYELLKFLAANRGRVFTRESLLNKIWGHDYYGGDRTVDVHIRRLRTKIEWGRHTFIETVRGVGYRFKNSPD